ncbi:MAG: hypothetical protein EBQ94_10850 [Flavobacteriales bacterium]|nr:hypothetical protein [Crocinitomicaceae bacterium]NBX80854.1 hypothetical protein [Flavobacteriales bacterium]NCA19641.1 hypothetical protein [Crocinitomicaceae bacterium]
MLRLKLLPIFLFPLTLFGQRPISILENKILLSNPSATVNSKFFSSTNYNIDLRNYKPFGTLNLSTYNKLAVKRFQFGLGGQTQLSKGYRSYYLNFDVNYTIPISRMLSLAVGAGAEFHQYGLYNSTPKPVVSNFITRLNAGFMFVGYNWRAGFSTNNINQARTYWFNDTISSKVNLQLYGEYRFKLNENWRLTTLAFIGTKLSNSLVGISAYYKQLQFGTTLGSSSISGVLGYTFKEKYVVGATYNYKGFEYGVFQNLSVNFAFIIPKKKVVRVIGGTPSF